MALQKQVFLLSKHLVWFYISNTVSPAPSEKPAQLEPPGHPLSPSETSATMGRWHSLLERTSTAATLTRLSGKCPSPSQRGSRNPAVALSVLSDQAQAINPQTGQMCSKHL